MMKPDRLAYDLLYVPLLDEEFDDADGENTVNGPAVPAPMFPEETKVWFD